MKQDYSNALKNATNTIFMSNYFIDTNTNQITFTDNRFYLTDEGQYLPSVTTILQAYPKDAHFYQWLKQVGEDADSIRDEAGRRGSIVHSLTERYDAGEPINLLDNGGNIGYKLAEWAMFERYVEFRQMHPLDVLFSEINICNHSLGYAGTIDRVVHINDQTVLIDIKTSNTIYDHYWLQLAAYRKLFTALHGEQTIDRVAILWLNAKTRTYDNAKVQGRGWQLIYRNRDEWANDEALLDATQKLWLAQNKAIKPKMNKYQLNHKI
jgi:hypothetical protein